MNNSANVKSTTADRPLPSVVQQAQLQLALHAMTQARRNSVIRCPGPVLAQAVADWLPAQLARWWPQAQVLQCNAHESHRLLEAFNALLQSQPPGPPTATGPTLRHKSGWFMPGLSTGQTT